MQNPMDTASAHVTPAFWSSLTLLRRWPPRRWAVALLATAAAALVIGVPTGVIPTSFYTRMTPTTWWDYPIWAVSSIMIGLTAATYVRIAGAMAPSASGGGRSIGATLLSAFAVGCPICNKLVVALIGVTGALNYFAPIQPLLGVASIGLLAAGLMIRLRGDVACSLARRPSSP